MKKKTLLSISLFLYMVSLYGQSEIIMYTKSTSANWTMGRVDNTGAVLEWEASNDLLLLNAIGNSPKFNFSNNDGRPIKITITNADNFTFLTLFNLFNDIAKVDSEVTSIDISEAQELLTLSPRNASLEDLDISKNPGLERLFLYGRRQMDNKALDTYSNPNLYVLAVYSTGITFIDIKNNPLLTRIELMDNKLSSGTLDKILLDLDKHGLYNGSLMIANQLTGETITSTSYTAYNNLISKGWTIDVPSPAAPTPPGIMITQYYEGNDESKWIEVMNKSSLIIPSGTYFLAMYDQDEISNIDKNAPSSGRFVSIPSLNPGQVMLFGKEISANTLPLISNIGIPQSEVILIPNFDFDGNDVILISSKSDTTCYAYRADIVGTVPSSQWGSNLCLIRGGNSNEVPEINFNINNWIKLSLAKDVDVANTSTNIALGNQVIGKAIWDGSTWQNFSPDKTRDAEIDGNYGSFNGNIYAYDLVINAGVELNFNKGTTNSVIVNGDLTINGTFLIGDQESLVMLNDNSVTTGSITKFEESKFRKNQHDVTYWSSPVSNVSIESVFSGVNPSRIFFYEQQNSAGTDPNVDPTYWNTWVIASGMILPGQGYAAEGPAGTTGIHEISFVGAPNNGLITFDIFQRPDGELDNDFNLIGNPYPCAIDIRRFFTLNSSVIWPEIFLWTHKTAISGGGSGDFVTSDYATYNLTGGTGVEAGADPTYNIGSGQGFFVRGLENSEGLLRFNNSIRIVDLNNQFFKSENNKNKPRTFQNNDSDRIWLNMTSDMGGFNQILIGFSQLSTNSVDKGYDALKRLSDNPLAFYSSINGEKYVIQGLGEFLEKESEVVLGFDNKVAPRVLTISIDKTEGKMTNANVYLIDNLLNKTHDLQKGSYSFEQKSTGENPKRFTLKFTKSKAGGHRYKSKEGLFVVSVLDDDLKIRSDKTIRNLKVYDMFGRLLIEHRPKTNSFQLKTDKIKTGTIINIESTFDDGSVVKRKLIKY